MSSCSSSSAHLLKGCYHSKSTLRHHKFKSDLKRGVTLIFYFQGPEYVKSYRPRAQPEYELAHPTITDWETKDPTYKFPTRGPPGVDYPMPYGCVGGPCEGVQRIPCNYILTLTPWDFDSPFSLQAQPWPESLTKSLKTTLNVSAQLQIMGIDITELPVCVVPVSVNVPVI